MAIKDPFEVLGVPQTATLAQIREAYRRLVKEHLWDHAKFIELNRAYEILTNPEKRQEFEASTGYKFAFTTAGSWWSEVSKEENMSQPQASEPTVQAGKRIESTQFTLPTLCPVCQTQNSPLEVWCQECGFLLGSTPGEEIRSDRSLRPRLTTLDGTQDFALKEGENSVGREDADVLLSDKTVSRRHACLWVENGRVWVEDIGSTNGTQVAGQPLPTGERRELKDGDEVRFGGVRMAISIPRWEPEAPEQERTALFDVADTQEMAPVEVEERPAPRPAGRLVWKDGSGREVLLYPGRLRIGRRSANDIALREDPYVSGQHAEIVVDDEGIGLIDLHSTNGTRVNEMPLTPDVRHPLQFGDEIRLGQQAIYLEAADEGQSADAVSDV